MYRIDVDDEPVGAIGFWQVDHDGVPAYETGWSVEPVWQGRGIASAALRQLVARVRDRGDRTLLVAYPGADNAASQGVCRAVGFTRGTTFTEPWRGGSLMVTTWTLDMSPLEVADRVADVDERLSGALVRERWWPYYLPHWASRATTAARWRTGADGLELRIDDDTEPWDPGIDGDVRPHPILHRRTLGQDGQPVDRLSRAAHARCL